MKYKNDVYIKVNNHDEEKLKSLLIKNNFEAIREFKDKDCVAYTIYNTKWNDNSKEVKSIISFINEDCEYTRGMVVIREDSTADIYGEHFDPSRYVAMCDCYGG